METMSTIESVKRTPSGAYAITFLGGIVAGTRDEKIGELAESLAGDNDANPVAVKIERQGGKNFLVKMVEIEPPPELGGEPDIPVEETSSESQEANAKLHEDVAKTEAVAPGSDPTAKVPTPAPASEQPAPTLPWRVDSLEECVSAINQIIEYLKDQEPERVDD